MEEDNTLGLMATHDFNIPIKVTVIFDESDEDTMPLTNVLETKQNDSIHKDETNNKRSTHKINSNELPSKPVQSSTYLKDNIKKLDQFCQKTNAYLKQPEYQESLKRKNDDLLCQKNINKQIKRSFQQYNNTNNGNNEDKCQNKSNRNNDIVSFSQKNSGGTNSIITRHQMSYTNQQPFRQQIEDCIRTSSYLKDLLNTVSEHLTFIMKVLNDYTEIYSNKNMHPNTVNQAKNHYYRTKYHLYDLSYSTIVNLVIPKEDDINFVNDFINSTVKLASKKGIPCSYRQVNFVFNEMIKWVKEKRSFLQNTSNKTFKETLNIHTQPQNPSYQKPNAVTDINKTCIFSYGPPGNEVRINIDPQVSNYQNRHLENSNYRTGNNVSIQAPPNYYDNHTDYYKSTQNSGVVNCQPYPLGDQRSSTMYQQNPPKSADTHCQNTSGYPPRPPPQYPNLCSLLHQEVTPRNVCVDNQMEYPPIPDQTTGQPETTRSSVSRDSGFISPFNFNTVNEQQIPQSSQCNESVEEEQKPQTTPLITHVTSLNPNVSYISNGPCHVCGKTTKTKCLGCYKFYYCSHECQILDWKFHMAICKKEDATNQFSMKSSPY